MAEAVHDAARLKELQALPLDRKIQISQARIIEWYQRNHGNVVVSFSGGKDSTVLLHLVRTIFPDVPAVFSNTGLEYPEIQRFVRTFPNVEIVAPKMNFSEVISTYGYPLIGKEVAEAIYYARRIRSHSVHVERERERENKSRITLLKRAELLGSRKMTGGVWHCRRELLGQRTLYRNERSEEQTDDPLRQVGGGIWKPTADGTTSTDAGRQRDFKRAELGGAEPGALDGLSAGDESEALSPRVQTSRGKWGDYHRRSLNPDDGNPDDRECFFNRKTEWSDWRRGCL